MQRGVETLDTYLKLLLQVLELRYITSLLFATRESCGIHIRCMYSQEQQRKPFYICSVRTGVNAKELNQSYFVNPHIQRERFERPFVNVFFFFLSLLIRKKKKEKKRLQIGIQSGSQSSSAPLLASCCRLLFSCLSLESDS